MKVLPVLATACLCAWPAVSADFARQPVLALRPTQIAVGIVEVSARVERLGSLGPHELERYLADHPVPVVRGPEGRLYMIDHHHLARAAWEMGVKKLPIEPKADYSNMTPAQFWAKMGQESLVYPYDQYGQGPHDPTTLPTDIRGLADDPYRSVSWRVRRLGGYDKVAVPFSEFKWADFFRKSLTLTGVNDHFDAAVREAMELARSPAAAHLPGYRP